ncbi:MAG: hypothetical protein U5L45_24730 [Saprospiraceae bacterium]|nr:hypothetical protein [Saprospiraceae bacterium]
MKHLFFLIIMSGIFSFCQNNSLKNDLIHTQSTKRNPVFRLSEHYSKFKFHDLKEFELDTFDYIERLKRYKELDSLAFAQVFQDDENMPTIDSYLYYSTFSDSTLIAILDNSGGEYGSIIWLLKYDAAGKLKNKIQLAMSGGDAGDYWVYRGRSMGNNTFIRTDIMGNVPENMGELSSNAIKKMEEEQDSMVLKIKYQPNSDIKIDTVFKK